MSRLSKIFSTNTRCFIPFVTAGHPDLDTTGDIIVKLAEVGAHIVEIGIPFSDPIADGPVIQKSSFAALQQGYSIDDTIEMVRQVRSRCEVGLIFMTYLNPVLKYGLQHLEQEAAAAGLDGILISDLTPEEYGRMEPFGQLDSIFLAAPTSSSRRLEKIARASRGFIYLVARTGVTGNRSDIGESVARTIQRIRQYSSLPIAVGFGITSAADVKRVWQLAEAAVVGTAIVRFIEEHREASDLPEKVGEYVKRQLLPVRLEA